MLVLQLMVINRGHVDMREEWGAGFADLVVRAVVHFEKVAGSHRQHGVGLWLAWLTGVGQIEEILIVHVGLLLLKMGRKWGAG